MPNFCLKVPTGGGNLTNWHECLERALRKREELERLVRDRSLDPQLVWKGKV